MSTPDSIRVQPGAANYFSHPGALDRIEQFHPAGTLRSVGHKHGEWRDTVLMQRALGEGDNTPPQRP